MIAIYIKLLAIILRMCVQINLILNMIILIDYKNTLLNASGAPKFNKVQNTSIFGTLCHAFYLEQ